jgi:hypothetical protein
MSHKLDRAYAYTVSPQKSRWSTSVGTVGGGLAITQGLRDVIAAAYERVATKELSSVDFRLDANRTNPVRDEVLKLSFGRAQRPRAAGAALAERLSSTMDGRSNEALLLVVVESAISDRGLRRISLLVLPRENVVQLERSGKNDDVRLNLLADAFSTASHLRKFARMSGSEGRTQFLSVEVLDLQQFSRNRVTADFWVDSFLEAQPRLDSATGTRYLVSGLQRALQSAPDELKDAAFGAMLKATASRTQKTSLAAFAASELPEELHDAFFGPVENDAARRAVFDIDTPAVRTALGRRIFTGADGVVVSAPAATVGKSVEIDAEGEQRKISYRGTIEKERFGVEKREAAE